MNYNHKRTAAGQVMPLLMGCTMPTPIEDETSVQSIIYDPTTQKVVMDMRVIGTKSLKTTMTTYRAPNGSSKGKADKKNEIDDTKYV